VRKRRSWQGTCEWCGAAFAITTKRRNRRFCSRRCAGVLGGRPPAGPLRQCAGFPGYVCERRVHATRCGNCRDRNAAALEAQAFSRPVEPGPKVCGRTIRGGFCYEPVLFQVNRDGRLVTWCAVHGEDIPDVIRPGAPNYPQDEVAA
jgi:hypothetical protein